MKFHLMERFFINVFSREKKGCRREKMDANRYRNEKNLDINVKILYCLIVA